MIEDDKSLTPQEALDLQAELLKAGSIELTPEQILENQNAMLAESLLRAVDQCEDARQFAAVIRLSMKAKQYEFAASLVEIMIGRLDSILGGYYDDIDDRDLVELVDEKLKQSVDDQL